VLAFEISTPWHNSVEEAAADIVSRLEELGEDLSSR
jgi:hypothetical protein